MESWSDRNISMMDAELHAEARARDAQLARKSAEVERERGVGLARRAERGGRGSWWRRLVRFRTLFLVVLAVGLAACALHVPGAHSPAGIGDKLVVTGVIGERAGVLKMTLTRVAPARLAPRTVVPGMPLDEAFKELSKNGWVTVEANATAPFWGDPNSNDVSYVLRRGSSE